jgi:hypothetical protein
MAEHHTGGDRRLILTAAALAGAAAIGRVASAGPLDPPPGPISPTPGPEPRTPVGATTTPGDAQSMYRITQPGSYYLTGNVIATGPRNGIGIAADNVTLDLNGFTIDGASTSGFPSGISSLNATRRGLVVRNGNINNFPGYGIFSHFRDSAFEDLSLAGNKSGSLELFQADNSIARHVRVYSTTGEVGIQLTENCRILDCVVDGGNTGIIAGAGSVISGCATTNQPSTGIVIGSGRVENCSVYTTTSTNAFNNGGISAGHASNVRRCTIRSVASAGVFISGDGAIEECVIENCGKGIASSQFAGGRVRIERNDICDCTTAGMDLPSGKHLVIANRLRGNAVSINAGAAVVLGDMVTCGPGALPAAAANPTANLVW